MAATSRWMPRQLLALIGQGVTRLVAIGDGLDVDGTQLAHVDLSPVVLDLLLRPEGEGDRAGEDVGLPDGVDDVRRLDPLAVDEEAALGLLDGGLGDDT